MHGAGEQQQRHRFTTRNDEQQPSTSSKNVVRSMHQLQPIQASLMCTPTTNTASSSSGSNQRTGVVRLGKPIKIGNNILEPAGTLVFSQGDGASWPSGQRVVLHPNKHAVVQANLFPITSAPSVNPQSQANGNWYMNQNPTISTSSNGGMVTLTSNQSTGAASATPDSGIQSVPTSPPSPSYELNDRDVDLIDDDEDVHIHGVGDDDDDDPADFTDMPTLKPADEDDDCYDVPSTSAGPHPAEMAHTSTTPAPTTPPSAPRDSNGMNAEEFLTMSIAKNMDPDEIVRRLYEFDAEKANSIAMLIKKRCAEESRKKKDMEAEVSSTTPTTPRARTTRATRNKAATRSTNSPDVTTSNLPEDPSTSPIGIPEDTEETDKVEVKRRGRKPKRKRMFVSKDSEEDDEEHHKKAKASSPNREETVETPEPSFSRPESAMAPLADPVIFRLKVREMMERQLEMLTQKMSGDMNELRLSHGTTSKSAAGGKRRESFLRQLGEQSKKLKKGTLSVKRMKMFMTDSELADASEESNDGKKEPIQEEELPPKIRGRLPSRRARVDDSPDITINSVEEKFNGEYYEIPKSIPLSDAIISLWKAPNLTCGCTKGACTSDMDCLNRAMRVQCNSECTLSYCSNRRFWKEDCGSKLTVSNGPRTKRVLKTKVARKAGEFLCEYAGEVITYEEAKKRYDESQDARIVAIGSQLFVDSTSRGNVARFIKHSCKPNSRLEVWSVSGFYRAGIFALNDLSTNVEITVDKSNLLPSDTKCNCGSSNCKKMIRGVRQAAVVTGDEHERFETRRFLPRNRRKTIERARRSGLPEILLKSEDNTSLHLKMRKVLAAFSFRVRRIDGSMPRSMLPYYSSIVKFLKSKPSNTTEFVSLFRKWLKAIDDDDLERAFVAIESHYLSSNVSSSVPDSKKSKENAPRSRALSTSCSSPVSSKRGDADLSYLDSLYPIGSYDPDDAWDKYRAKSSDNAVRCVCGALDEDGRMVQCDKCFFWLHCDCCDYPDSKKEEKEYNCDFCLGKQSGPRPSADVLLSEQPDVRFENCSYYRSLMNRRGIQVRLNETVYVNRVLPEDHKVMLKNLREEKKESKWHKESSKYKFPKAPTSAIPPQQFDRKETRIFRIERLFVCPGNNRFVFGSFYAWPHETYADTGRVFSKKEVFATPYYETLPLDEVIGRCLVVDKSTWCKGRPIVPKFKEDDVFFCEMQIGKNQRFFEKVPPKNRYPINTQPYVFAEFPEGKTKKVVRDFRPYDHSNASPKPPKTSPQLPSTSGSNNSSLLSESLPEVDPEKLARKRIQKVLKRLSAIKKSSSQSMKKTSIVS